MPIAALEADVEKGSSTDVVHVLGWTWNESCATSRRATSDTSGYKKTWAGSKMASGEIRVLHNEAAAAPALKAGDSTTLNLYTDASDHIDLTAIINSRSLEVDIDEGAVIAETLGFESDGSWTETRA